MMFGKVKITSENGQTRIYINETEVPFVTSFDLSQDTHEIPTLTLEIASPDMEIEIDGAVIERAAEAEEGVCFARIDIQKLVKDALKAAMNNEMS